MIKEKYNTKEINYLLCYKQTKPLEKVCFNTKKDVEAYIINLKKEGIDIEGYIIANGKTRGGHDISNYDIINRYMPSIDEFIFIKELLLDKYKFKKYVKNIKVSKR